MAKYIVDNKEYEVDLTKYTWAFGDNCEGINMVSIYPCLDGKNIYIEEVLDNVPLLKEDNIYIYLNLYYTTIKDSIHFKSLWLELDYKDYMELVCTEKEIEKFNNILAEMER